MTRGNRNELSFSLAISLAILFACLRLLMTVVAHLEVVCVLRKIREALTKQKLKPYLKQTEK